MGGMGRMEMKTIVGVMAALVLGIGCGTQNPFGNDGESSPEEDAAVFVTYTQTVYATSISPVIRGDSNVIVIGDRNGFEMAPVAAVEPVAGE
jgi:hypothetical protein